MLLYDAVQVITENDVLFKVDVDAITRADAMYSHC
jgi:hypothetical protein